MKLGISLYPGLDADRAKSLLLLQKAAALGYSRVFSSLHIPESNAASLREDALYLFSYAESLGLDVIADISPLTLKILDIPELTPARLKQLHITTARFEIFPVSTASIIFIPAPIPASVLKRFSGRMRCCTGTIFRRGFSRPARPADGDRYMPAFPPWKASGVSPPVTPPPF